MSIHNNGIIFLIPTDNTVRLLRHLKMARVKLCHCSNQLMTNGFQMFSVNSIV